ncbi:MAG TPA: helix-turn-helix domain-containing protein [Polyangia bacterium]
MRNRTIERRQGIEHRSGCPLASALDIVGDRWSLLIVRSMFVGATRYGDFLKDAERVATNVLADRLERLECAGLIESYCDDAGVGRYRLTIAGADLLPVLQALARWGQGHIADRWEPPAWFMKAKASSFYPRPRRASMKKSGALRKA